MADSESDPIDVFLQMQMALANPGGCAKVTTTASSTPVTTTPSKSTKRKSREQLSPASSSKVSSWSSTTLLQKSSQFSPQSYGHAKLVASDLDVIEPLPPDFDCWTAPINEAFKTARDARGRQIAFAEIGSVASGLGPEKLFAKAVHLQTHFAFACDPKELSYRWMEQNAWGQPSGCHFVDLMELAEFGETMCLKHECRSCSMSRNTKKRLNAILAGLSCKPFSMARAKRMSAGGCKAHPDEKLLSGYLALLLRCLPRLSLFENVTGFLRCDPATGMSPLQGFLQMCDEVGISKVYWIQCYLMDGSTFCCLTRRRLYILFLAKDCCTSSSLSIAQSLVKAGYDCLTM